MLQPRTSRSPLPLDRCGRESENLGYLVDVQAAEKPELYDAAFSLIEICEGAKGFVQLDQLRCPLLSHAMQIVNIDPLSAASPFLIIVAAGVVYQDMPHDLSRNREEMRSVLPLGAITLTKSQICFIDESRRLECVVHPFPPHVTTRQFPQLVMYKRHQGIERLLIAIAPVYQKLRNRTCTGIHIHAVKRSDLE